MSFVTRIQGGVKAAGEGFVLKGSLLLVERLEDEAKSKGGIVLGTTDHARGIQDTKLEKVRVVAIGAGYYDPETGTDTPLDTKVGDIIYTQGHTVRWISVLPGVGYVHNQLGLMDESATQIRFRGEEAIRAFERGAGIAAEVEDGNAE